MNNSKSELSFFGRLGVAVTCFFRVLGDAHDALRIRRLLETPESVESAPPRPPTSSIAAPAPKPAAAPARPLEMPPERLHASGLSVLAMLQREGRLIDFLQEDLAAFADADIGASARAVHAGCRKALAQCLTLEPVLKESEGTSVAIPAGFDANRIRLTGNVAGQGPFRGVVMHHGWATSAVRLPVTSEAMDPRVLAPAEVELS